MFNLEENIISDHSTNLFNVIVKWFKLQPGHRTEYFHDPNYFMLSYSYFHTPLYEKDMTFVLLYLKITKLFYQKS